jgi:hypothetical protein
LERGELNRGDQHHRNKGAERRAPNLPTVFSGPFPQVPSALSSSSPSSYFSIKPAPISSSLHYLHAHMCHEIRSLHLVAHQERAIGRGQNEKNRIFSPTSVSTTLFFSLSEQNSFFMMLFLSPLSTHDTSMMSTSECAAHLLAYHKKRERGKGQKRRCEEQEKKG